VEGGQVTAPAIPAGLPHAQEPEGLTVDCHIHSTYATMVVNGLSGWRDTKVRNFSQSMLVQSNFFGPPRDWSSSWKKLWTSSTSILITITNFMRPDFTALARQKHLCK
jgi:hypothetical protein